MPLNLHSSCCYLFNLYMLLFLYDAFLHNNRDRDHDTALRLGVANDKLYNKIAFKFAKPIKSNIV